MIYIRTDANEIIATGHIMRCISIAKELASRGMKVQFLLSDEKSIRLLRDTEFSYQILHTDWRHLGSEKEIEVLRAILASNMELEKPVLLVDSYAVDNGYFLKLKEYAKLIYMDDLFAGVYDVDMLINYTIYYKLFNYDFAYSGKATKLLLGMDYTPLREQFQNQECIDVKEEKGQNSLEILLMCGGGDPFHILSDILRYGDENGLISKDIYHIVAGAYHPQIDVLRDFEKRNSNIYVHQNVKDMASLMQMCDIAVSAAGTTLYECCAVGLPTVFFCMVDNQQYDGLCFSRDDIMLYAGDLRFQKEQCIKKIFFYITYLKKNTQARYIMGQRMKALVDGNGTKRVAEEIEKLWRKD
ncbi:MAG: UDP-2,4-diacetamido-2,4,6-trideoxy-beta-L-altropyranose hydrolase [Bacteroides sp.]|nr:UDP-2,4-diacetamido-2,4,6-trideoxy-beta-L-altropyranose hydrolase [Bacteroides sp.]MCM1549025.1 UDP-2,4-diacetamido-2,4,6-trideoxy-beta-L-altropyranose hydrolase [Clostridium sp.]